jgi:hypothetical protein
VIENQQSLEQSSTPSRVKRSNSDEDGPPPSKKPRPEFQNVPLSIKLTDVIPNGSEEELATLAPMEFMSDGALQAAATYQIEKTPNQFFLLPVAITSKKLPDSDMFPVDGFDKLFAVQFVTRNNDNEHGHYALHVVDYETRTLQIFDSSPTYITPEEHAEFQNYLVGMLRPKYRIPVWNLQRRSTQVNFQTLGYECGDFVLGFIRTIIDEGDISDVDHSTALLRPEIANNLLVQTNNGRALLANFDQSVEDILRVLLDRYNARRNRNLPSDDIPSSSQRYFFTPQQQKDLDELYK